MADQINFANERRRGGAFAWALFVGVLIFSVGFRAAYLNRPFERDPEGCGSFYGLLARNFLRYPVSVSWGVPIQSLWAADADVVFYPNHPPLVPWLIAGTYRVCGFSADGKTVPPDWETRLSTTLFTLACVVLIFVLVARRVGARAGALGAFFFAAAPLVLLYGGQPDVINSQLVFFALLSAAMYERFCDEPCLARLAVLGATLLGAFLSDWVGFYLPVVFAAHFAGSRLWQTAKDRFSPQGSQRTQSEEPSHSDSSSAPRSLRALAKRAVNDSFRWPALIGGVACLFFALEYIEDVIVTHRWNWMGQLVARRTLSNVADSNARITLASWVHDALLEHGVLRSGWAMCFFALGWLVLAVRRRIRNGEGAISGHPNRLIGLMLAWAGLHVLIGRQGVLVHEWWWWPVMPGVAMAAGVFLDWAVEQVKRSGRSWGYAGAVYLLLAATAGLNVFNVTDELAHPKRIVFSSLNYGITEMGQVIREAARPGEAVMLAESDDSLSLWFYADRPLKRNVWSAWDVQQCLRDGIFDIPFGRTQKFDGRVAAVIVPRAYVSNKLEPLLGYLRARATEQESEKFLVFEFPDVDRRD